METSTQEMVMVMTKPGRTTPTPPQVDPMEVEIPKAIRGAATHSNRPSLYSPILLSARTISEPTNTMMIHGTIILVHPTARSG